MNRCILIVAGILALGCNQTSVAGKHHAEKQYGPKGASPVPNDGKTAAPASLLSLTDAEKILGEPGHLSDTLTSREGNELIYKCAYKANAEDLKTHKTGILYFLVEYYDDEASAQKRYSFIKKANEPHRIKTLNDLGDEAYFHSDNQNFYFVMVRKGPKVFNMKVNKVTSNTSLDAFNNVARQITNSL